MVMMAMHVLGDVSFIKPDYGGRGCFISLARVGADGYCSSLRVTMVTWCVPKDQLV